MGFRVVAAAGVLVLGLGAVVGACGLDVTGSGGPAPGGEVDGGVDATFDGGAGPDTSIADAGEAGTEPNGADADAGAETGARDADCVAQQPPRMVRVGSVCVDETEVTNDQYRSFLAAANLPVPSAVCTWNATFVPDAGPPPGDAFPVLVNWCDAQAYCTWAGKRLCGKLGGGSLTDDNDTEDPTKGQWAHACTNAGATAFPYGNTFNPTACASGDVHPTAALSTCQGPAEGLFDMSGNVWEWVDACNGAGGADDDCAIMGGSFQSTTDSELKCRAHSSGKRADIPHMATGFRCCSP
jgi:formylglycine-generating enzyme